MSKATKQLLERIASWPDDDIEKLEEAACAIETWRASEYHASERHL